MNKVAQIIERDKEKLAKIISLETGKNYNESIAELTRHCIWLSLLLVLAL